jgi:hypothetical protein
VLKKKQLYPLLLMTCLTVVRNKKGEAIDSKTQSTPDPGKRVREDHS